MKRTFFLTVAIFCFISAFSQEVSLRLGTEFPLQHYFGINYQHNSNFSAEFSIGIVDSPYNDELYDWIRVPEDKESRKDFLQETTDDGWVLVLGGNYHKNKWYFGINTQLIRLNASGSYNYIVNSDLVKNDLASGEKALLDTVLTFLKSPLGQLLVNLDEKVSLESTLFQLGVQVGRKFQFKNPKFSMNLEFGFSANLFAQTEVYYNEELSQRIESFAMNQVSGSNSDQIIENLNFDNRGEELNEFFEDYAYIPSLSIGFSYLLYKK